MPTLKQALGDFAQYIHNPKKRTVPKSVKVTPEIAEMIAELKAAGFGFSEIVDVAIRSAYVGLLEIKSGDQNGLT